LAAICARFDVDQEAALENIFFVRALNSEHQKELLDTMAGLLVEQVITRTTPPRCHPVNICVCILSIVDVVPLLSRANSNVHPLTRTARGIGRIG
jgi:RecA/RadA recombinase